MELQTDGSLNIYSFVRKVKRDEVVKNFKKLLQYVPSDLLK